VDFLKFIETVQEKPCGIAIIVAKISLAGFAYDRLIIHANWNSSRKETYGVRYHPQRRLRSIDLPEASWDDMRVDKGRFVCAQLAN
jgi:hypothetical protein